MDLLNKIFGITNLGISKKIRQNFALHFPNAKNIEWTSQKDFAEAIFYDRDIEKIARYDKNGNLIETRINISPLNVPEIIQKNLNPEFEIMNCIAVNSNESVIYELIIRDKQLIRYLATSDDKGKISTPEPL
ncbi:MAG: hypothetical protein WBJ84_03675 [Bacteroidales bacterium]